MNPHAFLKTFLHTVKHINSELDNTQQKLEKLMATAKDFDDLVAKINTETDRLAAKIQAFIDGQNAGGMTPAEEDKALAGLQTVADRLGTIGANPANPIPPVPAEPPVV